jgi:hypothetical protein
MARLLEIVEEHKRTPDCIGGSIPAELRNVIDRVSTLSKDIAGWDVVKLTFRQNEIEAYSERASGKITEIVPLGVPLSQPVDMSIWMDAEFILEAAQEVPEFFIKAVATKTGTTRRDFVFQNEYYTQIVTTIAE